MGNSVILGQAMHGMFLDSKKSFFKGYFGFDLVSINEYEFRLRHEEGDLLTLSLSSLSLPLSLICIVFDLLGS